MITYDPAFWSTGDDLARLETASLFAEKRDFIRAHNMVLFNLHDHWRDRMPDGIAQGMAAGAGLAGESDNANLFQRPPTTLLALAQELGTKLNDKTLRVVGDPKLPVTTVATSFGHVYELPGIAQLNGPCDVLVCGYMPEWEVVEYAQDLVVVRRQKGADPAGRECFGQCRHEILRRLDQDLRARSAGGILCRARTLLECDVKTAALILALIALPAAAQNLQSDCRGQGTIGYARLSPDGTVLSVTLSQGAYAWKKGDPNFARMVSHLGGIAPGERKPVPAFC